MGWDRYPDLDVQPGGRYDYPRMDAFGPRGQELLAREAARRAAPPTPLANRSLEELAAEYQAAVQGFRNINEVHHRPVPLQRVGPLFEEVLRYDPSEYNMEQEARRGLYDKANALKRATIESHHDRYPDYFAEVPGPAPDFWLDMEHSQANDMPGSEAARIWQLRYNLDKADRYLSSVNPTDQYGALRRIPWPRSGKDYMPPDTRGPRLPVPAPTPAPGPDPTMDAMRNLAAPKPAWYDQLMDTYAPGLGSELRRSGLPI